MADNYQPDAETIKLREAVERFSRDSDRQTNRMLWLTVAMFAVPIVQVIVAIIPLVR